MPKTCSGFDHPPFRQALPTCLLPLVLMACGNGDVDERWTGIRAVEGVEVVEHEGSVRDLPELFRISESPRIDLGGPRNPPEHELDPTSPFHDAVRLSDGRFVVPDFSDLKVFGPAGDFRFSMGQPGGGPGEFGQVFSACIGPDNVIAGIDYVQARVSVFDDRGGHLRTFPLPGGGIPAATCFGDGSLLVRSGTRPGPEGGVSSTLVTVSRVDLDGRSVQTIGDLPAFPSAGLLSPAAGAGHVLPHGQSVYVGLGLDPEVRVYRLDGTLARVIRWREPRVRFTDEVLADLVREGRFPVPSGSAQAVNESVQRLRQQPRPEWLPVYGRMKLDARGRIWLEDHEWLNDAPLSWTVFDPSGRPLGRVHMPELPAARSGVRLGMIGEDELVLIWRDAALGFAHVSMHALERVLPSP